LELENIGRQTHLPTYNLHCRSSFTPNEEHRLAATHLPTFTVEALFTPMENVGWQRHTYLPPYNLHCRSSFHSNGEHRYVRSDTPTSLQPSLEKLLSSNGERRYVRSDTPTYLQPSLQKLFHSNGERSDTPTYLHRRSSFHSNGERSDTPTTFTAEALELQWRTPQPTRNFQR
jgi:hypothetical protein